MVLVQNVIPQNVLHYKTSFLQNVVPHSILPQIILPQNIHLYKTSSYTKCPPLQNVFLYKTFFRKMSTDTKRPWIQNVLPCTQPNLKKKNCFRLFLIYMGKHKQYELLLLLFKLFISFIDYTYNISINTNIKIYF